MFTFWKEAKPNSTTTCKFYELRIFLKPQSPCEPGLDLGGYLKIIVRACLPAGAVKNCVVLSSRLSASGKARGNLVLDCFVANTLHNDN